MEQQLLTPQATADALSMSRSTIYALMQSGALPSVKVGRARRVPAAAVAAYVERLHREQGVSVSVPG